ncbi:FMN-binding protein [Rhizobium sp. Root1203]|uniref:FMN-binding protein n=1 Tax=Rhizobium sp. Root1203 TaxID=1736427 RepID=UPI000A79B828|nr:hypothetical protein [Rhizobium sp. Root1203]
MTSEPRKVLLASVLMLMVSSTADAQGRKSQQYADGVYTATGEYGGQPSHITVKATLKDGVITAVTITPHAYVPESLELQQRFAAAVPKLVVGKPIDQVKVGKLAGSSGTPKGFNDAIEQIKRQAARN